MFETINIVIGTAWIFTGLTCLGLSVSLIAKRIGRNSLYGIRFPESFQSDEAWFAINHFGGQRLALWSIPQIAWGIGAYFVPLHDNPNFTILTGIAPIAFILIPGIESWRFAKRFRTSGRFGEQTKPESQA
jgi:hypothetical protein